MGGPAGFPDALVGDVIERFNRKTGGCGVLGLCGAQGSGKSTLARQLRDGFANRNRGAVILALDDLYLSRAHRRRLAEDVHPLFATRGPPGTHDTDLGVRLLHALRAPGEVAMPVFDKGADDRAGAVLVEGPFDVVILEGWCVGATPEEDAALSAPVNALEAARDPAGAWRRAVNARLAQDYRDLFDRIEFLAFLAAPDFAVVARWRQEQEEETRGQAPAAARLMDAEAITTFVAHYERLTRHMLRETPGRADMVVRLDRERRLLGLKTAPGRQSPARFCKKSAARPG